MRSPMAARFGDLARMFINSSTSRSSLPTRPQEPPNPTRPVTACRRSRTCRRRPPLPSDEHNKGLEIVNTHILILHKQRRELTRPSLPGVTTMTVSLRSARRGRRPRLCRLLRSQAFGQASRALRALASALTVLQRVVCAPVLDRCRRRRRDVDERGALLRPGFLGHRFI
jgi:hypothetical protein